jgi:hypothetical protein
LRADGLRDLLPTAVSFFVPFVAVLDSEVKNMQIAEVENRDSATIRKMDRADSKWVTSISNRLPLSIRNRMMGETYADAQKCESVAISARRECLFSMSWVIF